MSMQPTSNAAGRDGSALRMLKLFRARPLLVGDVRTGTIPSLLPSQKHYLKVYRLCSKRDLKLVPGAWPDSRDSHVRFPGVDHYESDGTLDNIIHEVNAGNELTNDDE
ncbi:MAG: hypothetical protein V1736_07850 [Pseudomonadota bacterium]